jgi:hypothetical protein
MQVSKRFVVFLILGFCAVVTRAVPQKPLAQSPQFSSAKTIFFKNQTGSDGVGKNTLATLKKWGRFRIVRSRPKAGRPDSAALPRTSTRDLTLRVAAQAI